MKTSSNLGPFVVLLAICMLLQVPARALSGSFADLPETPLLNTGDRITHSISGGDAPTYRIAMEPGWCADLTVEQIGVDVVVQVLDPSGKLLTEFDAESRARGKEHVQIVADANTDYQLRIKTRYPRLPGGRYELTFAKLHPAAEHDKQLFHAHVLSTQSATTENAPNDAWKLATEALAIVQKEAPGSAFTSALLVQVAELSRRRGDSRSAEQLFQQAVAADKAVLGTENPQTAYALLRLGALYDALDDYPKAAPLLTEALDISRSTLGPGHPQVVKCLMNVSLLHENLQEYDRSMTELKEALAIAKRVYAPDEFGYIAIVNNIGNLYREMDDFERAEPFTEEALHLVEKRFGPGDERLTNPLMNLAIIAREMKHYDRALALIDEALAIRERVLGSQNPETAALEIVKGNIYRAAGEYDSAIEIYQKAQGVLEDRQGPYDKLTLLALENLALGYAAKRDVRRAIEYREKSERRLEQSIGLTMAIGSEREKLAYLESASEHTDRTISLNLQQAHDDPEATELAATVLLQRQGRVLDAMSSRLASLRIQDDPEGHKLIEEWTSTSAEVAKFALHGPGTLSPTEFARQLAVREARRDHLEAEISERSSEFRVQEETVTLDAIRATIPAGAVLIQFAVYRPFDPRAYSDRFAYGKARYVAYVMSPNGEVKCWDLGDASEIDREVEAWRRELRDPNSRNVRVLSRKIESQIIEPLRTAIGEASQLLICPDGQLNLIPFEALVDPQGKYLVQRYSLAYLSAARDLMRLQVARQSKSPPVVIADPAFDQAQISGQQVQGGSRIHLASLAHARRNVTIAKRLSDTYFAPLWGTALEARSIKALFPSATLLMGPNATKQALQKLDAPSILHIATHGFFLSDADLNRAHASSAGNPLLRSGLALSGANFSRNNRGQGILTALEAADLNLWGTKLVTLSACDTGVGEIKDGEGVYGLRRAFFLAGAETVVMSLWPVSDSVTRELMTKYYAGLKAGRGRGEALRDVQLTMIRHRATQHPFYWASFIQVGDWRPLTEKR